MIILITALLLLAVLAAVVTAHPLPRFIVAACGAKAHRYTEFTMERARYPLIRENAALGQCQTFDPPLALNIRRQSPALGGFMHCHRNPVTEIPKSTEIVTEILSCQL
jgi:hypothetical protein